MGQKIKQFVHDWGVLSVVTAGVVTVGLLVIKQGYQIDQNHADLTQKLQQSHNELTKALSDLKDKVSADYTEFKKLQGFVYSLKCNVLFGDEKRCDDLKELLGAATINPPDPLGLTWQVYEGAIDYNWAEIVAGWSIMEGSVEDLQVRQTELDKEIQFMKTKIPLP